MRAGAAKENQLEICEQTQQRPQWQEGKDGLKASQWEGQVNWKWNRLLTFWGDCASLQGSLDRFF